MRSVFDWTKLRLNEDQLILWTAIKSNRSAQLAKMSISRPQRRNEDFHRPVTSSLIDLPRRGLFARDSFSFSAATYVTCTYTHTRIDYAVRCDSGNCVSARLYTARCTRDNEYSATASHATGW